MRESEHDVEVRDGQQVLNLLLQPLGTIELLAARTVTVAAGVWHEVFLPAAGTLVLMTTQRRCVTGGDGSEDLPVVAGQTMLLGEVRQCGAHDLAQRDGLRLAGFREAGHKS